MIFMCSTFLTQRARKCTEYNFYYQVIYRLMVGGAFHKKMHIVGRKLIHNSLSK